MAIDVKKTRWLDTLPCLIIGGRGHFAISEIFVHLYHLIMSPILEYFWKNSNPLLIITPCLLLRIKYIKTKLLTQSKTESFLHQQCKT